MSWAIHQGDALEVLRKLPSESARCCVTSPPYFGLRDYGVTGQIGLETSIDEYVARILEVFGEVRRVLKSDGTLWLNIGDAFCSTDKWGGGGAVGKQTVAEDGTVPSWHVRQKKAAMPGIKPKDLLGIPWRLAFALRDAGWWLRSDIIWSKPNAMPESVGDRPTKAHEYLFLLAKSERYYYDAKAIEEPALRPEGPGNLRNKYTDAYRAGDERLRTKAGLNEIGPRDTKNKRTVWTIPTKPFPEAHFATFPPALVEPCILAGSAPGDTVIDPFTGAATVALVALRLGRSFVGSELKPEYVEMGRRRVTADAPLFNRADEETA